VLDSLSFSAGGSVLPGWRSAAGFHSCVKARPRRRLVALGFIFSRYPAARRSGTIAFSRSAPPGCVLVFCRVSCFLFAGRPASAPARQWGCFFTAPRFLFFGPESFPATKPLCAVLFSLERGLCAVILSSDTGLRRHRPGSAAFHPRAGVGLYFVFVHFSLRAKGPVLPPILPAAGRLAR
jgi:hypothetical protein